MQTEFVRSLNCNYERILLEKKPEEKRYQYCILNRGGIKGLLPCSLRYINGAAYLYYDISSKQNLKQLYSTRSIPRGWIKDFLWSLRQTRQELERFLLDAGNLLFFPGEIFQDLESNVFSFVYMPYHQGDNGFRQLLEFWVEHIDYNDDILVECVYHMFEEMEKNGDAYLESRLFEDAERLNAPILKLEEIRKRNNAETEAETGLAEGETRESQAYRQPEEAKKHFFGIFENRKKKNRETREAVGSYQPDEETLACRAVAEDTEYGEEYGKTIYMEEEVEVKRRPRELRTPAGKLLAVIDRPSLTLGKRKGEADVVLENMSVSRLHARITEENGVFYIEDLNSTNGTFKNGLRLQPYEKREMEEGDEIQVGRIALIFR
ncbi:MAG: FHA domain-containing protein [Roseburia sp.]|nr:FHA domain-containing protein [Roseburia sp.]MCM1099218.1 FHA domain-containing protein [Ruminococcus flavefaciens]